MAERIPQSTSYLVVFRAYLASDGATLATGKTIAITISKNGATSFSNPNAGATNATEMASGFYKFTLDTTDTGTLGPLTWRGAQADINDAGDVLSVVKATNAGFSALPDAAAEASGGLYTRGTGAGQLSQTANGELGVATLTKTLTTYTGNTVQTGDAYARLGAPAGASVSADVAAVKTDTGNLVTRITSTLFSGITSLSQWLGLLAGKQTGNSTARTEIRATGAGSGTFDETTDSQEALRDRGDAAWITATSVTVSDKTGFALTAAYDAAKTASQAGDAMALTSGERTTLAGVIWDRLTSALTTVGSIGKLLVDNVNATISSRLASASYTAPPSAASVADQVWEETLADHSGTAGSTAAALNAAGGAGDPWSTALPGSYGSGTAGKILGDNLNATVSSRSSHSAADVWASGTRTLTSFGTLVADAATAVWAAATRTLSAFAFTPSLDPAYDAAKTAAQAGDAMTLTAAYDAAKTAATQVSVDDLPTNAELTTALGTADDAVLAAIAALSIPTATQNADALLARDLGSGTNAGTQEERTVRSALRFNRNKFTIAGGTLTVYTEDDTTVAFTAAITQTAGNPVSASDPT